MSDRSTEEDQTDAEGRRARGEFVRGQSGFRAMIGRDPEVPPEPGRYHLLVALNCPWCHRVTLARAVLGLEAAIGMSVAFPNRTAEDDPAGAGLWEFAPDRVASLTGGPLPECTTEGASGRGLRLAKSLYEAEGSDEKSMPVLYDTARHRIVSNESAEILRMLNAEAEPLGTRLPAGARPDLYPAGAEDAPLRDEIDALNEEIYTAINNGAYKAGFSSDQAVYARAFERYFE
ncbi:MAG: glutathione S-transferase, partial [Pseudomonadota bacterium]